MTRTIAIFCCILSFLGITIANAEEEQAKAVRMVFFDSHTVDVPAGWKRVEDEGNYQIESADGEVVFTATKYEAKKDGWNTFWKIRLKPDFPGLKWSGRTEMVRHKEKDDRKKPISIFSRYEGKVMGAEIVYYTVSINCGDFFVSANFVGDKVTLPPDTDLPMSILKSIRLKEVEQGGTGHSATRPQSRSGGGEKPQPEVEGRSR